MSDSTEVLIVGGGSGGIFVAALLAREEDAPRVTILEPREVHYYQPIWTLVGGGVFDREVSVRQEEDLIPEGATWIQEAAASFDPENRTVTTDAGRTIGYENLVVAAGIQIDWEKIPGLADNVGKPGTGVVSNYSYETVAQTWQTIKNFHGGTALFTEPNTPIKCGGAPQKIMYLADDAFRKQGVRDGSRVIFAKGKPSIFSAPKYARSLEKVVARKGIETRFNQNLTELRVDQREAVFQDVESGEETAVEYEMVHVTPPMSAPDFLKESAIGNEDGWVEVDKHTLRHVRYPDIFALGDCSSLPTSKTGAAVHKQGPVLAQNLMAVRRGGEPEASYDGYTSCPLVTGYGRLILAEFDYDKNPEESFPFDQGRERYSMYALKAHVLPRFYWHGMLRGRA